MANPANKISLIAALALCASAGLALADNYDDLSRSDFISTNAGDAGAANVAIQSDNLWPTYLNKTHIHTSGIQSELVMDQYYSRHAKEEAPPPYVINIGGPAK